MKELLIKLDACEEARMWAGDKSWSEIYNSCHRGDWLLWLFCLTMNNFSYEDFALLTIAKGHCANTVRHLITDPRSLAAVDAAINYSGNKKELQEAADIAGFVHKDGIMLCSYGSRAAYSAANKYSHSIVAYNTAQAVDDGDEGKSRIANQLLTANLVRQYIPIEKWNIKL